MKASRPPQRPVDPTDNPIDDPEDWPVDRGRPWLLRLLALVGALAFVMLGLNSLLPVLQEPLPRPRPHQQDRALS